MPGEADRCFDLGLVMAGAVSAGAYTAGVMDFLIQALNAWESGRGEGVPDHRVSIKVMAGTSAGGMTSSIAAATLSDPDYQPVTNPPSTTRLTGNRLFDAWVNMVDIMPLLDATDLEGDGQIMSLLDSSIITEIAGRMLAIDHPHAMPAYVDKNLRLFLTYSNLRGVPYAFRMNTNIEDPDFNMSLHADFAQFYFGSQNPELDDMGFDRIRFGQQDDLMQLFAQATMGTGAFPIGLAPRQINNRRSNYNERLWRLEKEKCGEAGERCYRYAQVTPDWPGPNHGPYPFTVVDGGIFNNKPLELARRVLTKAYDAQHYREMKHASREADCALLMIDPFPNDPPTEEYRHPDDLLEVIMCLLGAMRRNALFKTDELELAQDTDVGSSFLISPVRRLADGSRALHPLACGGLEAFSGFLTRDFRVHDFRLGRRNCQNFLRNHLVLRSENPLFDSWRDKPFAQHYLIHREGNKYLPIVPLMDAMRAEESWVEWPTISQNRLKLVRKGIGSRSRCVAEKVFEQQISKKYKRVLAQAIYNGFISPKLVRKAMDTIIKDLETRGQL